MISGLTGAAALTSSPLRLLLSETAEQRVSAVLRTYLRLECVDRGIVRQFVASLLSKLTHSEHPAVYAAFLKDFPLPVTEDFANYVLQEFLSSTNFYAVQSGEERKLRLLTALRVS